VAIHIRSQQAASKAKADLKRWPSSSRLMPKHAGTRGLGSRGMSEGGTLDAAGVNRDLTRHVVAAGERLGFEVVTENPVPGARLDVVWAWRPPTPIPQFDGTIPVVRFEIESSGRTREHVKGDFLNLQDAGVALCVIVLAGSSEKDASLRRFAHALVDRPGTKVLIWTEHDIAALAQGRPSGELPTNVLHDAEGPHVQEPEGERVGPAGPAHQHTDKDRPLWEWLVGQQRRRITVTFSDIEGVLGFPLPDSCRSHAPHWYSYDGSAVARAIIDAAWRARQVQLNSGTVTFVPQQ
jgi:hypothetical protein